MGQDLCRYHYERAGGVTIGYIIAAMLIYCVIRSPGTVLLLVALGAAAISRG